MYAMCLTATTKSPQPCNSPTPMSTPLVFVATQARMRAADRHARGRKKDRGGEVSFCNNYYNSRCFSFLAGFNRQAQLIFFLRQGYKKEARSGESFFSMVLGKDSEKGRVF